MAPMKHRIFALSVLLLCACRADERTAPATPPVNEEVPPPEETPLPNFEAHLENSALLHARAGTLVEVAGTVANTGTLPAEVTVRWTVGGVEVGKQDVKSIWPNDEHEVTAWIELPALASGVYDLTLEADPNADVAELDEADNVAKLDEFVDILHGIDYEARFLAVTSPTLHAGEVFSVQVLWRNDGSLAAPSASAQLSLIGPAPEVLREYVQDITIPALAPRSQLAVTYAVQPLRGAGNYFWEVSMPTPAAEIEPGDNFARTTNWTQIASRLVPLWASPATSLTDAPAWGSFTTDGTLHVLYGTGRRGFSGQLFAVTAATGEQLWSRPISDVAYGIAAIGDATGNADTEIFVGARDGVYALRATDGALLWRRTFGYSVGTPVLTDMIAANDTLELVVTAGVPVGGVLAVLRADDGSEIFKFAEDTTDAAFFPYFFGGPAVGDVNGDGTPDIAVATASHTTMGYVGVFTGAASDYTRAWKNPSGHMGYIIPPVLSDVDGDGKLDVITGDRNGTLSAVRGYDGQSLWQYTLPGTLVGVPLALGDTTGDAQPELAVFWSESTTTTQQTATLALVSKATGVPLWTLNIPGLPIAGPLLADLDGDGQNDVLAAVDTPRYTCLVLTVSSTGTLIDLAELPTQCLNSLGVVDADGDGVLEILTGAVQLLATPYVAGTTAWPKQGRDAGNTHAN